MLRSSRQVVRMILLPAVFLLLVAPTSAQDVYLEGLDAYVEKALCDWRVPGAAIGIVRDDALVFARGYGVRELGKPGKVDERTLFAVASNTKAFTAALLGMLVEEGKIGWDDPVTNHLKDFQLHDPYVTREIRIRDLLTHRSGLPTFGGDHLWIGNTLSREEILYRVRYLEPTGPFRAKFQYQNLMFLAAGQVVPAVTGESWDEAVKRRIFTPLGMKESNTSIQDLRALENVAAPHEVVDGKLVPVAYDNVDNVAPAAAVNSNIVEMAKWMRLNLAGGVYDGKAILGPEIMRDMQSIQMPTRISRSNEKMFGTRFAGYGLGWGISDYKGRKVVRHGGGLSGMISIQAMIPGENFGVIVLSNFAPSSLPRALAYRIIDALLGEPERDWSGEYLARMQDAREAARKAEQALEQKRALNTKPSLNLQRYTGRYFDELSGEARVYLEDGKLVFNYNPRHIGDLEHWHYDTFRLTWRHPIFDMKGRCMLTFELDAAGEVDGLKLRFYDPIHFTRRPETK